MNWTQDPFAERVMFQLLNMRVFLSARTVIIRRLCKWGKGKADLVFMRSAREICQFSQIPLRTSRARVYNYAQLGMHLFPSLSILCECAMSLEEDACTVNFIILPSVAFNFSFFPPYLLSPGAQSCDVFPTTVTSREFPETGKKSGNPKIDCLNDRLHRMWKTPA